MDYPKEFSRQARANIEAARIRAKVAFREPNLSPEYPFGMPVKTRAMKCVMAIVTAFGREACELGRPGFSPVGKEPWGLDRIERETTNFLKAIAAPIFRETGAEEIQTSMGTMEQAAWTWFMNSEEWKSFEKYCLVIADLQVAEATPIAPAPVDIWKLAKESGKAQSATAREIEKLRTEARMTLEDLAAETKFNVSTISRHESGEITPQPWRVTTYERVFSNILERQVVIPVTPIRRNKTQARRN